jgi:multiple sugar transport system permease protein
MLLTSFKSFNEILELHIWPRQWTLENYKEVLFQTRFARWFLNSVIVAAVTTSSVLFFCSLIGYTLVKLRFPGKKIIFWVILSTLMIPVEMLVIPWFVMSSRLDWVDSYWGLMFPTMITAFGIFLMRQFFQTLPSTLIDSSRIDGLSEFGIFRLIALPLVTPALSALGIFTFIKNWNAFLWPLVIVESPTMRTLPVGAALFSGEAGAAWNLIMTASALSILPVFIVFLFFQRNIIQGVVLSGIKG